jgi:hypothetical protein
VRVVRVVRVRACIIGWSVRLSGSGEGTWRASEQARVGLHNHLNVPETTLHVVGVDLSILLRARTHLVLCYRQSSVRASPPDSESLNCPPAQALPPRSVSSAVAFTGTASSTAAAASSAARTLSSTVAWRCPRPPPSLSG